MHLYRPDTGCTPALETKIGLRDIKLVLSILLIGQVFTIDRLSQACSIDPVTGQKGAINRYVRRRFRDVPLFGYPCVIEVELAQVFISKNARRMEHCEFVDKGWRIWRNPSRRLTRHS